MDALLTPERFRWNFKRRKSMRPRIILVEGMAIGLLSLSMIGCAAKAPVKDIPDIIKPEQTVQVKEETYEGSLWLPGSRNSLLFADHR